MEMLIVQGMRQFVRHHHAHVSFRVPVSNEKFLAVGVVESGNLLSEHFHERLFQRIIFRKQTELLHAFLIGIPFVGVLVLFHFLQKVGLDFVPRTKTFFERRKNRQGKQFTHLGKDFISSLQELSALLGSGRRQRGRGSTLPSVTTQHGNKQNDESGEDAFHVVASPSHTRATLQISISMSIWGEGMSFTWQISPGSQIWVGGRLFSWDFGRDDVFGLNALPLAGLHTINVARHLTTARRGIFVRFRAIDETESVSVGFVTGLLQQIRGPKRYRAPSIESPGGKHPCR